MLQPEAVKNAIRYQYSNGPTEGHNNNIKNRGTIPQKSDEMKNPQAANPLVDIDF
jgi:hypothetical protein